MNESQWKKGLRLLICLCIPALVCAGLASQAQAATTNNFTVKALMPENQISPKVSYFDLRTEPGQQQTIQLQVSNPGTQSIRVVTKLHAASTGQDGVVDYTVPDIRDQSLSLAIVDVAQVLQPEITVSPGGSALINVALQMPEQEFDGVLLGGLNVSAQPVGTSEPAQSQEAGVKLQNEFVYVVGLQLSQNDTEMLPELHLTDITPGLVNHRTALTVGIRNSEAVLMKDMRVLAQVYKRGSDAVFQEKEFTRAEMAPNSTGNFVIGWGSSKLEAGEYRLYLRAEHQGRVWEWDEPFQIASGAASAANSQAVNLSSRTLLHYLPLGLLLGFILFLVFWLGRRSAKKRKSL